MKLNVITKHLSHYENIIDTNEKLFIKQFLDTLGVEYIIKKSFNSEGVLITYLTNIGGLFIHIIPLMPFIEWCEDLLDY